MSRETPSKIHFTFVEFPPTFSQSEGYKKVTWLKRLFFALLAPLAHPSFSSKVSLTCQWNL